MDKVNVILCTYNGEKYLMQLLDSLFCQTHKNITIWIRDDGSTDNTVSILWEYCQKKVEGIEICILEDTIGNLGYVKNFLRTIRASGDADYYAFCDQDDYWLPEKIECAVHALSARPSDKCLIYSSSYETRDSDLCFVAKGHVPTSFNKLDVGKSLSLYDGGWLLGFTLVINHTLQQKAFDNDAQEMYSHDIWTQAVAIGFGGELIYDDKVTAYFRRHENTTSIAESSVSNSTLEAWKYRWNEFFGNGKMYSRLKNGIVTYAVLFADKVPKEKDRIFLRSFAADSDGKRHRCRKLFYPHRLKQSLLVELAWRLSILRGKM